jgi:colanic acid/amylovoran biosynthesis glycosyltransferase
VSFPVPDMISVVIPAHDESAVIARCLDAITVGANEGELEIIVVCNGCSDDTASLVRRGWPDVTVVETVVASKTAALNLGDNEATSFPRFYIDADIEIGIDSLRSVASQLRDGTILCAAPRAEFVLDGRPRPIRHFYRIWQEMPFLNDNMVGSGVYALSSDGRARFGAFPEITADDQFVMQHFAPNERVAVFGATFRVHTPRQVGGLIRMRTRVYRGNTELASSVSTPEAPTGGRIGALVRLGQRPLLLPAVATYVTINTLATARARWGAPGARWERDESARRPDSYYDERAATAHRVGYVISRYPAPSHSFVMREIDAARASGLDVRTFSVKRANDADLLSDADRREAATTWAIRPVSLARVALSHLRSFIRHPRAWSQTFVFALRQSRPGLRAHIWQILYFAEAVVLAEECRRQGIRHLHAHLANVAADIAWIATELGCRNTGPGSWKWTFSMHGPTEFADLERFNLASKATSASLVLCISDFARSQLMAVIPPAEWGKLRVVHMGVDLQKYFPAAVAGPSAADHSLEILSVGRLDPVKGQAILLEACAELVRAGSRIHLTLVGAGPDEPALCDQISDLGLSDVVEMVGAIGQDDLPDLYRSSDIFCLPSFAEGVPVVLMEAMACAVPVISTVIAGIPELVESPGSGLLVAPGRVDLLVQALQYLIDHPERRREIGEAGRKRVVEHFDSMRCGADAAVLLESLRLGGSGIGAR